MFGPRSLGHLGKHAKDCDCVLAGGVFCVCPQCEDLNSRIERPQTAALDKVYLDLSRFVSVATPKEEALMNLVRELMFAGCEALNCMDAGSEVQIERRKFYVVLNKARLFFRQNPIDPDQTGDEY